MNLETVEKITTNEMKCSMLSCAVCHTQCQSAGEYSETIVYCLYRFGYSSASTYLFQLSQAVSNTMHIIINKSSK